jgi:hypothetical protein
MIFKVPRIERAVLVNADKWSFVPGQLYWLRAGVASCSNKVDVFGPGWDRSFLLRILHRIYEAIRNPWVLSTKSLKGLQFLLSRPRSYRGTTEDKVKEMSNYKIAVIVENSAEYISEKLFDAWFAGCIPVYVGPSLKSLGLKSEFAIESEPDCKSVLEAIDKANRMDCTNFQTRLSYYISSGDLHKEWSGHNALMKILFAAI